MEKYNLLTFLHFTEGKLRKNNAIRKMALFMCDCGDKSIKAYDSVKCGNIKHCASCGRDKAAKSKTKHGLIKHSLYRKWQDMLNRCRNEKVDRYKNYGGRGIKVCHEWANDFGVFYNWCIASGWKNGLQVDRIDVDKNYEPSNCRIVEPIEQGFNKQNTFYVYHNGKKYSLAKLCYEQKLKYHTIWKGLKSGVTFEYYINKLNIKLD